MTQCIAFGLLEGYSRGEAPEEQRRFVETHCAVCDNCRRNLEAATLAMEPESPEDRAAEAELVAAVTALRPVDAVLEGLLGEARRGSGRESGSVSERRRSYRSRRWIAGASAVAAAVAAAVVLLPGPSVAPPELNLPYRAALGRPALAPMPHAPFVPLRGVDRDPPEYDRALGWLLSRPSSRKADVARYLAALYLWRGEKGDRLRAEEALRQTPEGAPRDNDIGVMLLASGEGEAALMAFDAALEKDAGLLEALFNRGLALELLGRKEAAIGSWETYLGAARGSDDEAWVTEARQHLESLRQEGGSAE